MKTHNLDEGVQESFNFVIKGHEYRFRHMTTEEIDEWSKLEGKEEAARKYLYQFIEPVDKDTPKFEKISQKMLVPHWRRFIEMVKTEFGASN